MDRLRILRQGQLLAELGLGERPIEIGRDAGCDVVLDDPELAARHYLVAARRGTVVVYDVSSGKRALARESHLPYGRPLRLGRDYRLLRELAPASGAASAPPGEGQTEALRTPAACCTRLRVLVGASGASEMRGLRVGDRPLAVGRAEDNDIVLSDTTVTSHHCRLEPTPRGLLVRDLGRCNGTYVNGLRVESACIDGGAELRLGRSSLHVVEARVEVSGAARSSLIAESPGMLQAVAEARRAAQLSWPTLLLGESGTGKEALASLVHDAGPRSAQPFVALNAGGLPADLIEAELFGYERGAFTGATQQHRGFFEQAHRGTLFLDEIGELPLPLQARLLRVLETGEVRRVGAESSLRVDVRVVCATHRGLQRMVAEGRFRQDLFFRIAQLVIEVPPLRSRPQDVQALSAHFLAQMASEVGERRLSAAAMTRLVSYPWPGNARELRNVLSSAAAANPARMLELRDVEQALLRIGGGSASAPSVESLRAAVAEHRGNLSAAARTLGMPRTTLRDRLRG